MFNIIKSVDAPEYDGTATLYRHECGMEVLHIKNNSEELCGNFIFSTISEDDTGVAHILEHTVLCGSEKFPVKDPFSEILLTSPNTYLNAMTFPDKTMYPFASPLKKDFDIIFDIYSDAVFAPLLRKESFQQEGVRFCTGTIDGVVFNEMKGALSSEDDIASRYSVHKLFEGTPAEYESGGDPEFIPDLTYEAYLDRYQKWYSPANCRLFLYGSMDAQEYLKKIEDAYLTPERLKNFSEEKLTAPSSLYFKNDAQPVYDVKTCPTKDASTVLLNWLTTESDDPFEILTLSVLTDILLGNPGAPLYKAIIDSGLGDDLSSCSGMESDFPILTFSVGFTGAKKNSEKEIEAFILSTLKKFGEDGIDINQQKACLKRQKFKLQEIPGAGYPYGILVGLRASRFWLRGKDPISCIDNRSLYHRLEQEFDRGRFFENWILKNLVNNSRRCLLSVIEDPAYDKKLQSILDGKYNKLKSEYSEKDFEEERQKFEKFIASEDSEESLGLIPRITKNDLPERIPKFALETKKLSGLDVKYLHCFTRDIVYFNVAFDASGLDIEELKLFGLLVRTLQMCGTKKHSYPEVGVLIKQNTGSFSIIESNGTKQNGEPAVYLIVRCASLVEDSKNTLDIIREILLETDLDDIERISASITDIVTDYESEYLDNGALYSSTYSLAQLSQSGRVSDILNGTEGYLGLNKMQDFGSAQLKDVSEKLKALKEKIICKNKMTFEYCCDEEKDAEITSCIEQSLNLYPSGNASVLADFYSDDFTSDFGHKILSVSGGPAYNSIACRLPFTSQRDLVSATLVASIFNNGVIYDSIRGQGGAYGAGCQVDMSEKTMFCYSYRDPNIDKTFEWFVSAFESEISQKDIDFTVAALIGKELKPFIPKTRAYEAFRRYLYGLSDELYLERRKNLLSLTRDELMSVCAKMRKCLSECGSKVSICGKEMVKDNITNVVHLPI